MSPKGRNRINQEKYMNNVAFVTYNQIGKDHLESGWHGAIGRRALVLQNTRGEGGVGEEEIGKSGRLEQIDILWSELKHSLPSLDHVVVYVGANGSQRAIALAAQLPDEKVTFVACACGLEEKEILIHMAGLPNAGRVLCECGGHRTMRGLYDHFMATGVLPTNHN